MQEINGGITAPAGFRAGTAQCGIKSEGRPDLAVIVSETAASCAGVFTTNRVKAAPVLVSREHVSDGTARAVVANSGNANACTGEAGIDAALAMASSAADCIGCDTKEVLVASTGVIGRLLPIEKIQQGIGEAVSGLSRDAHDSAARAIMTTDTVPKEYAVEFEVGGKPVRIGAIAKGAGMIRPDMATMLAFITTDAAVEPKTLQRALKRAVSVSFNCITVDGDMSTNDTVLLLANGESGIPEIRSRSKAYMAFERGLTQVCTMLAKALVHDGEGASTFVTVHITGAASVGDAKRIGYAIAHSPLVKTAVFGNDPNWGRILAAAGYSGVAVDEHLITISVNDTPLYERGSVKDFDEAAMRNSLGADECTILVDVGMGRSEATVFTTDLTYDYITINAEYTT